MHEPWESIGHYRFGVCKASKTFWTTETSVAAGFHTAKRQALTELYVSTQRLPEWFTVLLHLSENCDEKVGRERETNGLHM